MNETTGIDATRSQRGEYQMKNGPVIDGRHRVGQRRVVAGDDDAVVGGARSHSAAGDTASISIVSVGRIAHLGRHPGAPRRRVTFCREGRRKIVRLEPVEPQRCSHCGNAELRVCFSAIYQRPLGPTTRLVVVRGVVVHCKQRKHPTSSEVGITCREPSRRRDRRTCARGTTTK